MSPRKIGVVAALVRGRSVEDALTILDHTPRSAALPLRKAILSARANAEHNHNYKPGSLFLSEISISSGPRFKRYRAAARGRALKYQRKTSHISILVDGERRVAKKTAAKAEPKTDNEGDK